MRWFKRPMEGDDKGTWEAYQRFLAGLDPPLPPPVRELAGLDLHDGLFDGCVANDEEGTVRVAVVRGDLQQGYSRVVIGYKNARWSSPGANTRWLLESGEVEVLSHEVDLSAGGYVHRLCAGLRASFTSSLPRSRLSTRLASIPLTVVASRSLARASLGFSPRTRTRTRARTAPGALRPRERPDFHALAG